MSTRTHRTHGWHGDAVVPDWPALDVAEVQAVLDRFPQLQGPVALRWHSPRPFSAAARVQTHIGEVFVKRHHHRLRTAAALCEEHAFIAHLRQHALPVPQVFADAAGHTAIVRGDWTYEVHALAAGVDMYRDCPSWTPLRDLAHAHSAGRMLARLHQAAADYNAPARSIHILIANDTLLRSADMLAGIHAQCQQRPALADFLRQRNWQHEVTTLVPRHRALYPQLLTQPRLWTHGDWHASNLCWQTRASNSEISTILDFGLCAPTFALFDLATAIERNAIAWLRLEDGMHAIFPDTARALIAGYADVLPLSLAQRHLLAEVLPLVHLDFALSEVEYFHAITGHAADAELAWRGFFLGHAAWFDTAPGQAMLAAIRAAH